jgi:hypothetical protein
MRTKDRYWMAAVTAVMALAACAPLREGATIDVEFQNSAQGLRKGDQVYLLGVPVGEAGTPYAVNNRAHVPVVLPDPRVFDQTSQVFFLLAPDEAKPGRQCLVAYVNDIPAGRGETRFRGFTSKVALNLEMGTRRAESWWRSFTNTR